MTRPRDVVLLGSTGSIGTQAADVVRRNPEKFRVVALGAGGGEIEQLARQALDLGVEAVAVAKATAVPDLQLAFYAEAQRHGFARGEYSIPKIFAGPDACAELAAWPADVVLNGINGSVGLAATMSALSAGRTLALANKESLIAGGPLVKELAKPGQIVPVDSEHSALVQCLRGGSPSEVSRLVITASGGPFRGRTRAQLSEVTPSDALAHPTWAMGPVITVNSATLVNKALEVIEGHLLFDIPLDRIDVVVHPQSIVHSMVEFCDGATIVQASPPDMRLPIAVALGWPDRVPAAAAPCDWRTAATWEFLPLDEQAFPAVAIARAAAAAGGTAPAVFNAANEECVAAFLSGRLPFLAIVDTVEEVLAEHEPNAIRRIEDVYEAEGWARARARELSANKIRETSR